jgi:hypothetical protein
MESRGFEFENVKVLIDTPTQAFAEDEFTIVSSKTGKTNHSCPPHLMFGVAPVSRVR